jgi:hypothetical protein
MDRAGETMQTFTDHVMQMSTDHVQSTDAHEAHAE